MSLYGETHRTVVAPVGEAMAQALLTAAAVIGNAAKVAGTIWRAVEHRRALAQVAGLDDHMLRDIGLTRSDIHDAASVPLTQDPTRMLVLRATERRAAIRLALRERSRG